MDLIYLYDHLNEWRNRAYDGVTMMNDKLNRELARLLYKQAPFVSISLYALLTVAAYFYFGLIPNGVLLTWGGVNFTLSSLLLFQTWRYRHSDEAQQGERWIRSYTVLAFVQDLSWGLIGPISFMADSEVYRLLTLFMLGGMAAGSIATRGIVFRTYIVSIVCLLSPIIITLAMQNNSVANGMTVLTIIYLLFMLSVGKNYSSSISKNILLWLDNEKLISELRESKVKIEHVNEGLRTEIEQRKRIEKELLEAKERAERANTAKNQFLANVSHELRTPLNGIIGFSSILEKAALSDEQMRYVKHIGRSANSLLRNVNDILDITAIEAGHLKLYPQPFSLRDEMDDVLALVKPLAEQKGLAIVGQIDESVTDNLHGDSSRLRQIVTNILSNAIKYTEKGGVELRVKEAEAEADKVVLHFEIEDTGIGIPEYARKSVFDNFTQVENFERKRVEGVGLGLAIVKNLLNKMGGRIWLDSTPGQGSSFSFELPFRRLAEGMLLRRSGDVAGMAETEELRQLKVLVVDDNEVNRMVLTSFLGQHRIPYKEAANGGAAVSQIEEGDFDVVLLDIQMPDMSGIEVAHRVMSIGHTTPTLVAVTAHAFPEQREDIIAAGFSEFLIKPISEAGLIRVLNDVLEGQRHQH